MQNIYLYCNIRNFTLKDSDTVNLLKRLTVTLSSPFVVTLVRLKADLFHYFPPVIDFDIEILMHLRSTKRNKAEVSIYDPIGVDREGNEITLIDVLGTEPDVVADLVESFFEQRRLLEKVRKLSKREMKVLELRFGLFNSLRQTQREIAKSLGISRSYVSRIEKRAISKLSKDLKQENK